MDLSFDLTPYYGNPDLYINLLYRPDLLNDYKYKSSQWSGTESLTIKWDEIQD